MILFELTVYIICTGNYECSPHNLGRLKAHWSVQANQLENFPSHSAFSGVSAGGRDPQPHPFAEGVMCVPPVTLAGITLIGNNGDSRLGLLLAKETHSNFDYLHFWSCCPYH